MTVRCSCICPTRGERSAQYIFQEWGIQGKEGSYVEHVRNIATLSSAKSHVMLHKMKKSLNPSVSLLLTLINHSSQTRKEEKLKLFIMPKGIPRASSRGESANVGSPSDTLATRQEAVRKSGLFESNKGEIFGWTRR